MTKMYSKQNELGYSLLAGKARESIFPNIPQVMPDDDTVAKAKARLTKMGLNTPKAQTLDWFPSIPKLLGNNISEHFENLARETVGHRKAILDQMSKAAVPAMPADDQIIIQSGWTRYVVNKPAQRVDYPWETGLVFDTETFVRRGAGPVIASAVSSEAWYIWLHPALTNDLVRYKTQLIELGEDKVVVNHNVTYDSARTVEAYCLGKPVNSWFCTLSAHVAIHGISNKQREIFKSWRHGGLNFTPKWAEQASMNSLVETYNYYVARPKGLPNLNEGDKTLREIFVKAQDIQEFKDQLYSLIQYCVLDVKYTFELFQNIWNEYLQANPSLVSLQGHLELTTSILPVPHEWRNWVQETEAEFKHRSLEINNQLFKLAQDLLAEFYAGELDVENDPWLSQLDWEPAKTGATKGQPAWWRKLKKAGKNDAGPSKIISTKSRLAPYLLRLSWLGSPVIHKGAKGWAYKIPAGVEEDKTLSFEVNGELWSRIPHVKGAKQNCGNPLAKDYISSVENGFLSSPNPQAKEILELAQSISYWLSARSRVSKYIARPVTDDSLLIVPQIIPHGATTRRCAEKLWLTVCSPKKNGVGTELKAMVRAPKGFKLVGADFDAQEMRIASMFADAHIGSLTGATPLSWTVLCGDKNEGTDAHSTLASHLGISRSLAKTLNFEMLYMGGENALAGDIRKSKKELSEAECKSLAKKAIKQRRGTKIYTDDRRDPDDWKNRRYLYQGGTDSDAYNFMLRLCNDWGMPSHLAHLNPRQYKLGTQETYRTYSGPRTVMLGARMSSALWAQYCGGDFLTSRANATIQGTGVDILHSFLTALKWLLNHYQVEARFMMSYHDEVWALARDGHEQKAAACFQIAHLWAWSLLAERLGLNELPINGLWFSGVNIDTVWRKEVDQSIITPSNNYQPPNGIDLKPRDCFKDWQMI